MADDAVAAIALATRAPVLVAPSMNVNMWNHPLTRANLARLVDVAKYKVVGPGNGFLACRWTGPGRLAEPEDIAEAAAHLLSTQDLAGKRIVVSAGPTYEAIDPVRFVGNRSSGKMGIAIAAAAKRRGANVTLILGPSAVPPPIGVTTNHVETAAQLQWALDNASKGADAIIMTAAVADYRPAQEAKEKLKRGELGAKTSIELVANPDMLATLGKNRKGKTPVLVGFAAETDHVIENARAKLASKKVDLIVANDVSEPNSGFSVDTNHVQLVDTTGEVVDVPNAPKSEVAHRICDRLVILLAAETSSAKKPSSSPAKPAKAKATRGLPAAAGTRAKRK
jgi:phosphopantothenoylcysteine decarboxylase/phosphopantothenate--cysteine ligase